jgi:dihydroorotase
MADPQGDLQQRDIVITGAVYVDPQGPQRALDVVIHKGRVIAVLPRTRSEEAAQAAARPGTWHIDGSGAYLAPGFTDLHAHLRDFEEEAKETIRSGSEAAAAGGFTTVVAMANSVPPVDNVDALLHFRSRAAAAAVRVLPVAAVTRGLLGQEMTSFEALAEMGAVAFSDDGRNSFDLELATAAMKRAAKLDRPVLVHAQDEDTCPDGQADPAVARLAGVTPWPCAAEVSAVRRAIEACRQGGGRLHLQHLSCAAAVEVVAEARAAGLPVTAEVTPHHLALTSDRVMGNSADPMAKVNPPLRRPADREALVRALADGVIDAIATDHAPHELPAKAGDFASANFGFSGLETALSLCLELVDRGELTLQRMVQALTTGPASVLPGTGRIPTPGLRVGDPAELVLFDRKGIWTVEGSRFRSRGRNTPLEGREVRGRVLVTLAGGRPVMSRWLAGAA